MNLIPGATSRKNGKTRIQFEIEFDDDCRPGDTLALEQGLQKALNQAATICMTEVLGRFDTHGEPLHMHGKVFTSKGTSPATYQCYGGPVNLQRHTYQTSDGGTTYCPLEDRARIVHDATPHWASILAGTYSAQSGRASQTQLSRTLLRDLSLEYIQEVAEAVGKSVQAKERHQAFKIETPPEQVHMVTVFADSTCTAIVGEDYKHSAVGCFCLLDEWGKCLEKFFVVNAPEDKKVNFWQKMFAEAANLKKYLNSPDIPWHGACDGAEDVQTNLEKICDVVMLDFYHLSTYICEVKGAMKPTLEAQEKWVEATLHDLKHTEGAAETLLQKFKNKLKSVAANSAAGAAISKAAGYVERNLERMSYALARAEKAPIGSGVIEAGCKYIVKQRAGISGARWKRKGLQTVLSLRALHESTNRWGQFWRQCAAFGY
jgi:hypothetical protein